jgi:thiol-disulfide isomerase/thioredoxin
MNEYLKSGLIVLCTCILLVIGWKYWKGFYPGSSYVIETPPVSKNGVDTGEAKFLFFYTGWCPWSVKAWPKWTAFKQELTNKPVKYGGHKVIFEEIDCEANPTKAALYNVNAYPSFKLLTQEKTFVMQGTPDPLTFDLFLTGTLGEKTTS